MESTDPLECHLNLFNKDFSKTTDKNVFKYNNYIFSGDFNYDMLNCDKSAMLSHICDLFNLRNIIKNSTCFTKMTNKATLDFILNNFGCDFRKLVILVLELVMFKVHCSPVKL